MERDLELVRTLLTDLQRRPKWIWSFEEFSQSIDSVIERDRVEYHFILMAEAGLLTRTKGGAYMLSWKGHEFLDACRDERGWNRVKEQAKSIGGVAFEAVVAVAIECGKESLRSAMGLAP